MLNNKHFFKNIITRLKRISIEKLDRNTSNREIKKLISEKKITYLINSDIETIGTTEVNIEIDYITLQKHISDCNTELLQEVSDFCLSPDIENKDIEERQGYYNQLIGNNPMDRFLSTIHLFLLSINRNTFATDYLSYRRVLYESLISSVVRIGILNTDKELKAEIIDIYQFFTRAVRRKISYKNTACVLCISSLCLAFLVCIYGLSYAVFTKQRRELYKFAYYACAVAVLSFCLIFSSFFMRYINKSTYDLLAQDSEYVNNVLLNEVIESIDPQITIKDLNEEYLTNIPYPSQQDCILMIESISTTVNIEKLLKVLFGNIICREYQDIVKLNSTECLDRIKEKYSILYDQAMDFLKNSSIQNDKMYCSLQKAKEIAAIFFDNLKKGIQDRSLIEKNSTHVIISLIQNVFAQAVHNDKQYKLISKDCKSSDEVTEQFNTYRGIQIVTFIMLGFSYGYDIDAQNCLITPSMDFLQVLVRKIKEHKTTQDNNTDTVPDDMIDFSDQKKQVDILTRSYEDRCFKAEHLDDLFQQITAKTELLEIEHLYSQLFNRFSKPKSSIEEQNLSITQVMLDTSCSRV